MLCKEFRDWGCPLKNKVFLSSPTLMGPGMVILARYAFPMIKNLGFDGVEVMLTNQAIRP